ncbi:hypothetical protein L596_022780 [Steinernema carpocapsae]|uniref:SKP1 component POZ domain-containing protein n=1 Tax=Steinernema carpocapsae TaxID=34508 RepID=A0A4V6A0B5_STECR|nr:hypothetical protein L596_022780 [Steinernema carpocapsae]
MELSLDNLSLDDNSNLPNSDCHAKPFSLLSDGQILQITPKATEMCIFLQTGFEFREMAAQDLSEPFEIHEDLADPEILKLIVDFCEEYKDEPEEEDMSPMEWSSYYKIHKPLLILDKDTIFRLVNAADALQIPRLYKSVCSFIVKKYIDLKTPEEIRKTFWDIDEEDKCEASEGVTECQNIRRKRFGPPKSKTMKRNGLRHDQKRKSTKMIKFADLRKLQFDSM